MTRIKSISSVLLAGLASLALAACNTIHGAGHDVEEAGEAVQNATQ